MKYPVDLYDIQLQRDMVRTFGGLIATDACPENAFCQMENLTGSQYPALAPRGRRGTYALHTEEGNWIPCPTAAVSKDALCWVEDGKFYIGGYPVPGLTLSEGEKQLVSMSAWVVILPDKLMVNTTDHSWQALEAFYETEGAVTFTPCTLAGRDIDYVISSTPPEDTQKAWIDETEQPYSLKFYSSATESWVAAATVYTRISAPGIGEKFQKFDAVNLSGIAEPALADLNGWHPIWEKGADHMVVVGLCPGSFTQTGAFRAARTVPDMDFVIESKNRLWGCKYGMAEGKIVNEIYGSKLGDPTNWHCFMGISTDSQVISCGTDGQWTGAIAADTPLFFKEDWLHRIYGDTVPFGAQITACRGVQKGSGKSLVQVGETVFYKSRGDIMAFDGALPVSVSRDLGQTPYHSAIAGSTGSLYYVYMRDVRDTAHLFVYDRIRGMWHKEDAPEIRAFCSHDDALYALTPEGMIDLLGSGEAEKSPVRWYAVTGIMGTQDPDQKYLSRMTLRLQLAVGARLRISLRYDSAGDWEPVADLTGHHLRSFTLPIRPRRCDHLQVKLEGVGDCKLFSLTKTLEQGSDVT